MTTKVLLKITLIASYDPNLILGKAFLRLTSFNILGEERYIVDAVVNDQGPNYILAKRLQHWRAIVSKEDGCLVSTNIAPATATASVVSNKLFALAYKGQHHFKPLEVSQQETSNAVMGK